MVEPRQVVETSRTELDFGTLSKLDHHSLGLYPECRSHHLSPVIEECVVVMVARRKALAHREQLQQMDGHHPLSLPVRVDSHE